MCIKPLLIFTNIDKLKIVKLHNITVMKILLSLAVLVYMFALTSCGQTGALYMPKASKMNSGSTISTSGSTIATSGSSLISGSTQKVDNDPTKPDKSSDPHANELVDSGDNFGFDQNIKDSSNAGGTPS